MSFLPSKCRKYLASKRIVYEEVESAGQKGLILKDRPLPPSKYDASAAEILILLPNGYPDTPPDMFYMHPWVRLNASNNYARAADQPHDFNGKNWQRWSRHNDSWRPGTDGIWTMLKRVEEALEIAQ